MKSSLETQEGLTRLLTIDVPSEKVKDAFTRIYGEIQRTANIKGFRKGKAPIATIKSLYKDKVSQDVLQKLVSEFYPQAIDEHSIDPVTPPQINVLKFDDEAGELSFSATVEIRPEVKLKKIEGLEVEKEKLDLDETRIGEVLENIQKNFQEVVPVFEERPAQPGDVVKIDFEGFVDGQPLEGAQAEDHQIELGSNTFIPGFEEGVEGMAVGSAKTLDLAFPNDYHVEDLKGKAIKFNVTLKSINKTSLPELNDELAQKVSDKFKTMDELKTAIKDDLQSSETRRIKDDLKDRLLKALAKENPLEVPQSLKEEQKHRLIHDVEHRLKKQGLDEAGISEYKQKWADDFEDSATFMVQSSFLIHAIANKYDLKPRAEDIDKKLSEMAQEMNVALDKVKEYYNTPDKRSGLQFLLMEERVTSFLIDKAKVMEVSKDKLTDTN